MLRVFNDNWQLLTSPTIFFLLQIYFRTLIYKTFVKKLEKLGGIWLCRHNYKVFTKSSLWFKSNEIVLKLADFI